MQDEHMVKHKIHIIINSTVDSHDESGFVFKHLPQCSQLCHLSF